MAVQQAIPVQCPACGGGFHAPYESIIDGQNELYKSAFLSGRLHAAQCPQCGTVLPLQAPCVYYDMSKEIAFAFVPGGLSMTIDEQSKILGPLTQALLKDIKQEDQKFFLYNPKIFISMDSLVEAILEADGITLEVQKRRKAKGKILQELLQVKDDAELTAKITEHEAELDREFFEIATATMQSVNMEGNEPLAQMLLVIRTAVAQQVPNGEAIADEVAKEQGLIILKDRADLLQRFSEAPSDEAFLALLQTGYGMLDYQFFQEVTKAIDAANQAGDTAKAQQYTELRSKILSTKSAFEAQMQAAQERAVGLLQKIFQSSNPEEVLRDNIADVNEVFFNILAAHMQQAQQQNRTDAIQALEMVAQIAMTLLQEKMMQEAGVEASANGEQQPVPEEPQKPVPTIEIARR